jgi:UDP-3-O-[3-hydroxymyristoyl] N-acetylglucosamine deacetylase
MLFASKVCVEELMKQHTIRKSVQCSGIGLHGGRKVELALRPAAEDTGIVFFIHGENGTRKLKPTPESVIGTGLATTLGNDDCSVATVEHLLAAVRGLGIDNLQIDVHGGEIPIMDGSAASFVFLFRSAGLRAQDSNRRALRVVKPYSFEREGKKVEVEPYDGFKVDYAIDFAHPLIGDQNMDFELTPEQFIRRVAKARTFGFLKDVEMLQKNGLALGGSLDNAVVLDEYGVVNEGGLRYKDEFVRHKVLDFIGDMAVAPLPVLGHFKVSCSGHAFNNEFLRTLTNNASAYLETVEAPAPEIVGEPETDTGDDVVGIPAMA